jgi:hypothetical protein
MIDLFHCMVQRDNMNDPSEVPKFAEPWFLSFKADVQFHIVMTPEELERAGLEKLGKKWS